MRMEQIKYAHKTCLEFLVTEASNDHISDQSHSHSTIEIACVEQGSGEYAVAGHVYAFAPGDVLVFGSMEQHNVRSIAPGEPLRTIAVNFDPEFVASIDRSDYDLQFLDAFFYTKRPCLLEADGACAQEICAAFGQMLHEFDLKQPCYPLLVKAQLLRILAVFMRAFEAVKGGQDKLENAMMRQDSIAVVLSYIEQKLSNDLDIDLLSNVVHMNRYYFSTFFKKYVGESPIQYITRKRVALAMSMLDTTSLSILEIAIRSGFNNASNFNRVFKQITGKSPSDFKKRKVER